MRFLILNTDYPEFLLWLYSQHPELENRSYQEQMQTRNESLFGVADFYSENLRKLGHEAWEIHANNEFMQKAWAREMGMRIGTIASSKQRWQRAMKRARGAAALTPLRYIKPLIAPILGSPNSVRHWFNDILAAQIRYCRPDVLLNQAMDSISASFLAKMKPHVRLLMGQIAAPLPKEENLRCYDLIVSSLPNFVRYFRRMGVPAELHRLAFEPRVISKLGNRESKISISFVGSLSSKHQSRIHLLEYLCEHLDLEVWGQGVDSLPENSWIRRRYKGKAWGINMYRILFNSKTTLNHHVDIAESYANNMRLFEATGVGTLLVTDWKENLHEMFELNKEVVVYRNPKECAELIQYYLDHDQERQEIARAGQERTLRNHTYYQRMQDLAEIVGKYL